MSGFGRAIYFLSAALILASCAAPQTQRVAVSDAATRAEAALQLEIAAQEMVAEQKRLTRVYRRLATTAYALCGEHVGPRIAAYEMVKPKGDIGETFAKVYGIKERPTLLFTLEGGPADQAGLKARDVIMTVNGVSTADKAALGELTAKLSQEATIVFGVERDGAPMNFTVQPERACRYSARLSPGQSINAFADGNNIMVARGMMSFAKDDDELALVLSHEMAHNAMKHIEAKQQNVGMGVLADLAAVLLSRGRSSNSNFAQLAGNAYSQEFEAEADYVGLYIMANAGMSIADAPKFWRRMAAAHPANIKTNHAASHPSTSYRMVALEQTVKEINEKLARNAPLVPNMKDGKPAAPEK